MALVLQIVDCLVINGIYQVFPYCQSDNSMNFLFPLILFCSICISTFLYNVLVHQIVGLENKNSLMFKLRMANIRSHVRI